MASGRISCVVEGLAREDVMLLSSNRLFRSVTEWKPVSSGFM